MPECKPDHGLFRDWNRICVIQTYCISWIFSPHKLQDVCPRMECSPSSSSMSCCCTSARDGAVRFVSLNAMQVIEDYCIYLSVSQYHICPSRKGCFVWSLVPIALLLTIALSCL